MCQTSVEHHCHYSHAEVDTPSVITQKPLCNFPSKLCIYLTNIAEYFHHFFLSLLEFFAHGAWVHFLQVNMVTKNTQLTSGNKTTTHVQWD